MLSREAVLKILEEYDPSAFTVAAVASHSALDVFDGAVQEGLRTLAICEKGREAPYARFFRTLKGADGGRVRGVVDDAWVLDRFRDVLTPKAQERLRRANAIFVPNRSFTSYCDLGAIEDEFAVPLLGTRGLLRTEDRTEAKSYYWLLERAKLPAPERIEDPEDIDGLVIVKLPHKTRRLERGFFTTASAKEFREKSQHLIQQGEISAEDLAASRIERYVLGPVFNFDYFYSPIEDRGEKLELLGVDWRFETSLDGLVRLPAEQQLSLEPDDRIPGYTVIGHNAATIRESSLNEAFRLAERYVAATQEHFPPGIIGPFTLQTCVDREQSFVIFDVAPRIGGGTNAHMALGHPYGNALWRSPMSTGRRIALELRRAAETGQVDKIVS